MTDPRLGGDLLAFIQRLPRRSGVVFRHYGLEADERHALFSQIRRICIRRGHLLLLAGVDHGRFPGAISAPVHNIRELAEAKRLEIPLLFVSPVYPTRSHPGGRPLGLLRLMQLAACAKPAKVIALGGMTRNRAHALDKQAIYGWAGIDAFGKKPRR
jgi:thiamine-phosphate pyrophosphorylase